MKPCDKCGSENITYYKQQRVDGIWVVTARCENNHHPITGKPFYPISQFNIANLPTLGEKSTQQMELFDAKDNPTLLEYFEQKRNNQNRFPPIRRKNVNPKHN